MSLRKDDPVYYKQKVKELFNQAESEGLKIYIDASMSDIRICFESNNGEKAGYSLIKKK